LLTNKSKNMIRDKSEIQLNVESTLSPMEKDKLEQEIKKTYGENVVVKIKGKKIRNEGFEENRAKISNNNLKSLYEGYLDDNYTGIDKDLFFQIDEEIAAMVPDSSDGAKRFKIKSLSGKNILSFNEFELELDKRGILRVYSTPQNMGGKSNLIRIIKLLLFGEFYRSNQERSTLSSVVNKFSPLNIAHIEGEIEIEGKEYFIRRDFTRNDKGKVSQKILVSSEGAIIDTAQFETMVGKIKDFLFISFFDSFSIEKWLNTKPTERYRMFLNYFGLGNIEDKAKIGKQKYDDFQKKSISKNHTDIDLEINDEKNNVFELGKKCSELKVTLGEVEGKRVGLDGEIMRLKNTLKGVPDSLLNETEDSIREKIVSVGENISKKETEIVYLQSTISFPSESKEELQGKINDYQDQISKVEPDKELQSELEALNYLYHEYSVPSTLHNQKLDLEVKVDSLREKYVIETNNKKIKEELLSNTPDTTTCNICNGISDNKEKKQQLSLEIKRISDNLNTLVEEGVAAKKELSDLEAEIKNGELEYKKGINKDIELVKSRIEANKQQKIDAIKKSIFAVQSQLNQINDSEKSQSKTSLLKAEIETLSVRKKELEERLKNMKMFNDDLLFNDKINSEIKNLEQQLFAVQSSHSTLTVELKYNEKLLADAEAKLQMLVSNRDTIAKELKIDRVYKTYIEVHSKGGLAMRILNDLIGEINEDLAEILSEDDFTPFIRIENDAIEFYFERKGMEFNMAEGSGYEKTVLLLALHYLLLSKMVVPVSNIFILDEVFVAVALPNLNKAYNVVENYLNIFDTILLITHVEEIGNWCSDEIKIEKSNNISKIIL